MEVKNMDCTKCGKAPKYKDSYYCYGCLSQYLKDRNRFDFKKSIVIKDEDAHEKAKYLAAVRGQRMYEVTESAINNEFDRHIERIKDVDMNWLNKIIKK